MERPNIKDFFPDKTLQEMMLIYKNAESLFNYVKELDKYIDELESRPVEAVVKPANGGCAWEMTKKYDCDNNWTEEYITDCGHKTDIDILADGNIKYCVYCGKEISRLSV